VSPMSRQSARRQAAYLAAAAMTVLACCLAPATAGAVASATGPRAPVAGPRAPATFAGFLNDAACITATDCWAFGQTSAQHAVAEHWDGSAWAMVSVASPHGASSTYLPSVSCTSRTNCWAVGQYQQSTGRQAAYAEHWDGTAWSPVAVPAPAGSAISLLNSVSCAGKASCWAVGTGSPTTFMERWNGHAWTVVRSRGLGGGANPERVACPSATDCWLSGLRIRGGSSSGTLVGHWTASGWAAVPTPTSHIPADSLLGISCHAAACMAVGSRGNSSPLAQRWNGSAWTVTSTGSVRAVLYAVSCASPGSCMAVGGTNGGNGRVFTERWTGARWHVVPASSPAGGGLASLVGVACVSAADCWGVGGYLRGPGSHSLIEHWNGRAWSIAP
jgi:hypothetical protein